MTRELLICDRRSRRQLWEGQCTITQQNLDSFASARGVFEELLGGLQSARKPPLRGV